MFVPALEPFPDDKVGDGAALPRALTAKITAKLAKHTNGTATSVAIS